MASHLDRLGRSALLVPLAVAIALVTGVLASSGSATAARHAASTAAHMPDLGPNVKIFDPSMSTSEIKATVDSIAAQQLSNQFGTQRYALLFMPGTYGTAADPLNFQVGYYTEVAGLGASPNDVVVNGTIDSYNQCFGPGDCTALVNFWRSLSNLTINVAGKGGCQFGEFWATSQAAPMRRVHVDGHTTLMDYCSGPSFASGGFIADSLFSNSTIVNGSQQQYLVRNSTCRGWSNGVWNQVFAGVQGAPAAVVPEPAVHDARHDAGVAREAVPLRRREAAAQRLRPGRAARLLGHDLGERADARPVDPDQALLHRHARGQRQVDQQRALPRQAPPLHPGRLRHRLDDQGQAAGHGRARTRHGDADGAERCRADDGRRREGRRSSPGSIFDAGPVNSPVLLRVGSEHGSKPRKPQPDEPSDPNDPTTLHDVFFRIGGPHVGKATVSLEVNADDVDPRPHLGLARRPRHRRRLDGQHRRHRRRRQR